MGKTSKIGLAFAFGIMAGWATSVLMTPEDKERARKNIADKAKKLKHILTDKDEQERIKAIFNRKTTKPKKKVTKA